MNQIRSIRLVLLALLTTVVSAGLLSAEDFVGKFTLPFEAKWGLAALPAGDYEFTLSTTRSPWTATVIGKKTGYLVQASGVTQRKAAGRSKLIIVRSGGTRRVRALHLAEAGLVFSYIAPKAERQLLAQAPELIQRLAVVISGK